MTQLVHERVISLEGDDGQVYATVRVFAREAPGGTWEGWLEFETERGQRAATDRETTQSSAQGVAYWASGLEPVYLEGALRRALGAPQETA